MKGTHLPSSGEGAVKGIMNRDKLELWLASLLFEGKPKIFQQSGMAPPEAALGVRGA